MTTSTTSAAAAGQRVLSPRTRRTYAADWALFTDWCAATDTAALPADPRTVVEFLAGCPAAPATQRCRVAAIDHHHTAAGYDRPGESPVVRAAVGRLTGEPPTAPPNAELIAAALARLDTGHVGRRDRCLLVLSQLAGVPYTHLATLTAADIYNIEDGITTITTTAGRWTVGGTDGDPGFVWAVRDRPVAADPQPGRDQTQHMVNATHSPGSGIGPIGGGMGRMMGR